MVDILPKIIPVLQSTPARWTAMLTSYSPDLTTRKPAPGEWSAVECLVHILDVEQVMNSRLKAFLAGDDLPNFDPDAEGTKWSVDSSPVELAGKFAQLRAASLAALRGLKPGDSSRTARHESLGLVTLEQMLNEWAAHDLSHTVQAEEALMQPFIEDCGPWHIYFEAHKAA